MGFCRRVSLSGGDDAPCHPRPPRHIAEQTDWSHAILIALLARGAHRRTFSTHGLEDGSRHSSFFSALPLFRAVAFASSVPFSRMSRFSDPFLVIRSPPSSTVEATFVFPFFFFLFFSRILLLRSVASCIAEARHDSGATDRHVRAVLWGRQFFWSRMGGASALLHLLQKIFPTKQE